MNLSIPELDFPAVEINTVELLILLLLLYYTVQFS